MNNIIFQINSIKNIFVFYENKKKFYSKDYKMKNINLKILNINKSLILLTY